MNFLQFYVALHATPISTTFFALNLDAISGDYPINKPQLPSIKVPLLR